MEPHYTLPFRAPDTRTAPTWSTKTLTDYAIVSPRQQFQLSGHHNHQHTLRPVTQHPAALQDVQYYPVDPRPVHSQHYGHNSFDYAMSYALSPAKTAPAEHRIGQLPLPPVVLQSQSNDTGPCLACTRPDCTLMSHRFFTKHALEEEKRKQKAETTPRFKAAAPVQPPPPTLYFASSAQMDAQRQHLLSLWSTEWSANKHGLERHLFPVKRIDRVLPAAQNHMPLMQALLAYSGTIWAMVNNVMNEVASAQQAFAVEMLSQACPTEREAGTDEAILAATLLLLIYLAQGNGVEVAKHVSGLVHLTKTRGGPHYLGIGGVVAETLLHADHMQAIFFNHAPIWPLPLPQLNIGLPEGMGKGFESTTTTVSLDLSLSLAAKSVCRVADVLVYASMGRVLPADVKHAYNYLVLMAEYQLAHCNASYHASSTLDECVCLVLVLFNLVVLCNDGTTTPSILQVEYRFWQALEEMNAKSLLQSTAPYLYIWMLLTGLTVAIREPSRYRMICVEKLRAVRGSAGVTSWDQLRTNVLDQFLWLPCTQEETFRGIWLEVEGLKSDTSGLPGLSQTHHKSNILPPAG